MFPIQGVQNAIAMFHTFTQLIIAGTNEFNLRPRDGF
jgi:hypothetical protein